MWAAPMATVEFYGQLLFRSAFAIQQRNQLDAWASLTLSHMRPVISTLYCSSKVCAENRRKGFTDKKKWKRHQTESG